MKRSGTLRAALLGLLLLAGVGSASSNDRVVLYIPAFQSESVKLGLSVATVLNLQIWQTWRRSPWPNPDGVSFADALMVWDREPLSAPTHEAAEQAAARVYVTAQLVLWGKCYRYGEDVVALAYLSLPEAGDTRDKRPERWAVWLPSADGGAIIESDIPARRYAFEPLTLTRQVVDNYSRPDSLKIYSAEQDGQVLGTLGATYEALQHSGPRLVKVTSRGVTGWLRLPSLAEERSEVTDFVGGVVRVYRADWVGARAMMKKVTDNPRSPTQLKTDAHLYRAMAAVQTNADPEPDLEAAETLNPYSRQVVIYRAMALLSGYAEANANGRRAILEQAQKLVAERQYVFLPDDPWLAQWAAARSRLAHKS